jgi:lysophospholipase L1-like esterase
MRFLTFVFRLADIATINRFHAANMTEKYTSRTVAFFARRLALALLVICSASPQGRANQLQSGDRIAICGDSITQQRLYSLYMEAYLLLCQPEPNLEAIQFGRGGETVPWFLNRQEMACLPFKPSVVTFCYGMNDGGRKPATPESLEKYTSALTTAMENFRKAGARFFVVGSPGVVDTHTSKTVDPAMYNQTLSDFSDAAEKLAREQGAAFAPVHKLMTKAMTEAKAKFGQDYVFAGKDGTHPGPNGHLVMAYAFLKALGCDGDIGTIAVDLKSNAATASDGHNVVTAADGSVTVRSTRYPFCFYGEPDGETTRSMVEFIPFNQDLNRLILKVANPPAPKLQVEWGSATRTYDASELEKGINLAADFPDNPFSEPFAKAEALLKKKQESETTAIHMIESIRDWREVLPEHEDAYKAMEEGVIQRCLADIEASASVAVPVEHTIRITPVR